MELFAGLDVSIDETAVCLVDGAGEVVLRASVATDPQVIAQALAPFVASLRRVWHEACALSPWLQPSLEALGLPAVCLETRHVRAAMAAQRNKTDATDALGQAHLMRTGWFKTAYVKTDSCYRLRQVLTQRKFLNRKLIDLENHIRGALRAYGMLIGPVGRKDYDSRSAS